MRSVRDLLEASIDYAGLFPPAALPMISAVRNYAEYRRGPHGWALGRFVVAAERFAEFEDAYRQLDECRRGGAPWKFSGLGRAPAAVDTVELKAESPGEIRKSMELLPPGVTAYFEIPTAQHPGGFLTQLAQCGARAKVRTGGVTPEMVPASSDIARFLSACAHAKVRFKATAGLHHAVRSLHPLTYEAHGPCAVMHGFLNVFLAAALVDCGGSQAEALGTLEETAGAAFRFDDDGVSWHGYRLTTGQLRSAREDFAVSFGSCSFEEPMSDLEELGLL